jgi:hypothetical protein
MIKSYFLCSFVKKLIWNFAVVSYITNNKQQTTIKQSSNQAIKQSIMRFTTDRESQVQNTTEEFEGVTGFGVIYCLGFHLPYDILKKYEDEEEVNFTVRMRIVDEHAVMRVIINENVVFNDDIETRVYYRIMGNCDTLMNDITRYNQDNESDDERDE